MTDSKPTGKSNWPFRKRTVRIRFSDEERPILSIEGREYPIIELLKTAVRFRDTHEPRLPISWAVIGDVVYPNGEKFVVEGEITAHKDDETVLRLGGILNTGRINRRERFRVKYPITDLITFTDGDRVLQVNEIAEHGIRVVSDGVSVTIGEEVEGELRFLEGENLTVSGEVLRDEGEEYVVYLQPGIPLRRVMGEQLYLLRKYPR